MRIGVNGVESSVGQAYSNLVTSITDASYDPATGQLLSDLGTVVALEKGPDLDEFFLSFEVLGSNSNVFVESSGGLLPPPTPDDTPKSDIGLRTFDEINASMSSVTGIPVTEANVQFTFNTIRQSLPAIESVETFLSSHEIGIAQLAIEYCNALIEDVGQRNAFFPAFNFNAAPSTAYAGTDRDGVIDPLINNMVGQIDGGTNINTQPAFSELKDELGYCTDGGPCLSSCCLDGGAVSSHDNLIKRLLDSTPGDTSTDRTEDSLPTRQDRTPTHERARRRHDRFPASGRDVGIPLRRAAARR